MTEREKFEAWCREEALLFGLTYYDDDEYLDAYTQYAWRGWQGAIESQKTQLSSNPLQLPTQEGENK